MLSVRDLRRDRKTFGFRTLVRLLEQLGDEVGARDVRETARGREGRGAAPAGDVEDALAGVDVDALHDQLAVKDRIAPKRPKWPFDQTPGAAR